MTLADIICLNSLANFFLVFLALALLDSIRRACWKIAKNTERRPAPANHANDNKR